MGLHSMQETTDRGDWSYRTAKRSTRQMRAHRQPRQTRAEHASGSTVKTLFTLHSQMCRRNVCKNLSWAPLARPRSSWKDLRPRHETCQTYSQSLWNSTSCRLVWAVWVSSWAPLWAILEDCWGPLGLFRGPLTQYTSAVLDPLGAVLGPKAILRNLGPS